MTKPMTKAQAVRALHHLDILKRNFVLHDRGAKFASTPAERDHALAELRAIRETNSPPYRGELRKIMDAHFAVATRHRYSAGVIDGAGGMSVFIILASGDSWDDVVADFTRRKGIKTP